MIHNQSPAPVIINQSGSGPGCLLRILYFLCVGIWLGAIWTLIGWVAMVTIIGLPLGFWMLNRLPQVMTLKPSTRTVAVSVRGGTVIVSQQQEPQLPLLVRALYFVVIGWWLSGLWLSAAWGIMALSGGLAFPIAFWMFDRTPQVLSLTRM